MQRKTKNRKLSNQTDIGTSVNKFVGKKCAQFSEMKHSQTQQ